MIMQVDDDIYDDMSQWKWTYSTHGYAYRRKYDRNIKKYETIFAHRYVLGLHKGDTTFVDHRDNNKLNVQRNNLRTATPTQNNANRPASKVNKQSKYKGVCRNKGCNTWRANIQCGNKKIHIGSYDTEEEAAIAYNAKAKELFGEFAYFNEVKINE